MADVVLERAAGGEGEKQCPTLQNNRDEVIMVGSDHHDPLFGHCER